MKPENPQLSDSLVVRVKKEARLCENGATYLPGDTLTIRKDRLSDLADLVEPVDKEERVTREESSQRVTQQESLNHSPGENFSNICIAYVGNFGPYFSTENHVAMSLKALGCRVIKIQENETPVDDIFESARTCDLFLYTRTWGFRSSNTHDGHWLLHALKEENIPTVSFHLDLYINLPRGEDVGKSPFWKTDFVFSADGGNQKKFKALGVNHIWSSPAVLHEECYRAERSGEFENEIIFVGSLGYHSEWSFRRQLIKFLEKTYGSKFRLYGPKESIRGCHLNQLYASAKIVVGDSFYSPYYWSDRLPETLGRGGFLVFPAIPGLEQCGYIPNKHFAAYDPVKTWGGDPAITLRQIENIINYYLENPEARETMRLAGHKYVRRYHTYKNRMQRMLAIVSKSVGRREER